jgi:hypothetical protein
MHNHNAVPKNTGTGHFTLGHLLLAMAFCQPAGIAIIQIQHTGGGRLRYLIVAPVGLMLGFLIASFDWKLGKAVWSRSRQYSNRAQNRLAVALFCVQLLWIVLGTILGFKLAMLVAAHLPR